MNQGWGINFGRPAFSHSSQLAIVLEEISVRMKYTQAVIDPRFADDVSL